MYQPVPLNWIAGDESSFWISLPQVGQAVRGVSLNFRINSKRPH